MKERLTGPGDRRLHVYVPYDQLTDEFGPLSRTDPRDLTIWLVENPWKAARRPYHRQKLALVIANMRQFALEQAERGVDVRHIVVNGPYRTAFLDASMPIHVMRPAEHELRQDLRPLLESGAMVELPHEGWLTSADVLTSTHPKGPPWLLERFYRAARQRYNVLMNGSDPAGGRFNFDAENRHSWTAGKDPVPPELPKFAVDPIKREVGDLIEQHFSRHPGALELEAVPTTAMDATRLWNWAKAHCLANFGRYEDAMSERSSSLFHTRISALVNLSRLAPVRVVRDAEALDVPIASKEGFIRQVLGWREFMHHVHELTDGFRLLPAGTAVLDKPGDGGFATATGRPWLSTGAEGDPDGGAVPSWLGADTPLPPVYWGRPSGMNCMDNVVADVWRDGWSHHITRLMVLSNLATLLDVSPRELTDWFWVAYVDAYDWVVEPNVLGLGTYSVGPLFTTKPYVSGGNYIHKMSDYCPGCRFDPKHNCPFSALYWAFLERHRDSLERNPRLANIYRTARIRLQNGKAGSQDRFVQIRDTLLRGDELSAEPKEQPLGLRPE
ncbi:MAG TPA: cryptochrome/photolyase family protein [Bryobacteraceae bacterium]|nr:cryptochrome/photolyase family protein [Bryobacteraceae bacterium]